MKFLSNDYTNPNTNPRTLTTLTLTLTDPHNAFESWCAPVFCDFIRNYFAPKLGHIVTSIYLSHCQTSPLLPYLLLHQGTSPLASNLYSNIKFCLLFLRPKWGWHSSTYISRWWHLNIFVTQSDFRPLPHPFVLFAPWIGGGFMSLGLGQPWPTMAMSRSFVVIAPSLWNRLPPSARASLISSNHLSSLSLLKTCLFSWS